MERVERSIVIRRNYKVGDIYYFITPDKKYEAHSSLEEARTARRYSDWKKTKWTYAGGTHKNVIKEGVKYDPSIQKHYAFLRLPDDIIVSQPYTERKKAYEVLRYLHDNNWSIQALNHEIRDGVGATLKYSHILPTREGYIVMDDTKKTYGCFKTLEEAYKEKEKLMSKGVL